MLGTRVRRNITHKAAYKLISTDYSDLSAGERTVLGPQDPVLIFVRMEVLAS